MGGAKSDGPSAVRAEPVAHLLHHYDGGAAGPRNARIAPVGVARQLELDPSLGICPQTVSGRVFRGKDRHLCLTRQLAPAAKAVRDSVHLVPAGRPFGFRQTGSR